MVKADQVPLRTDVAPFRKSGTSTQSDWRTFTNKIFDGAFNGRSLVATLLGPTVVEILLLEDMEPFRRMLTSVLREAGHGVLGSGDGAITYDKDILSGIEVMITDIDMPKVNGIEAILVAKQLKPSLKIIAMSGGGMSDRDDYLTSCEGLGVSRVLSKPFEPDALLETLSAVTANDRYGLVASEKPAKTIAA